MRGTASKSLLNLSKLLSSTKLSTKPINSYSSAQLRLVRPRFTTTSTEEDQQVPLPSKPKPGTRGSGSSVLESFRLRKLKGSGKNDPIQDTPPTPQSSNSNVETESGKSCGGSTEVLSSFRELGLREEVVEAVEKMGIFVPSEVQCVGIPAVLDGKSLVLSSGSRSGRTLAYLLPLVQMLRRDETLLSMKPKHPRAIVLCTSEDSADQGFRVAKFISHYARLKSSMESGGDNSKALDDVSNARIGMLVGTPSEVLQYVEDRTIFCDDVRYLVLDEANTLFEHGFGPQIDKLLSPLKDSASKSNNQGFQAILVTSTISEMLGDWGSSLMERVEHDNAGKVTATLIEVDQTEIFDLIESPEALKKKVAEVMDSLSLGAPGS